MFYFSTVAGTFGVLKGWSVDQMVKLKERCISLYGSISTWDAADVREAGVALGTIWTHADGNDDDGNDDVGRWYL